MEKSSEKSKENMTVIDLKAKLKECGAKLSGKKAVLQQRLNDWNTHNLNRTIFKVPNLSQDKENFPTVTYETIDKLSKHYVEWLTPSCIWLYFSERLAAKGYDKGRNLFLCDFVKSFYQFVAGDSIYVIGKCSAEQKKSTDYDVKVHLNTLEHKIVKNICGCPAGVGPNAACKHVGAILHGIEYFGVTGKIKRSGTCTDVAQKWHKPTQGRQLDMLSVDQMMNVKEPYISCSDQVTNEYFNRCINGKFETALMYHRHSNLFGLLNDHQYCKSNTATLMLNKVNKVSEKQRWKIERKTRVNNKYWSTIRKTRITASIAHNIIRTCRTRNYVTGFLRQHIQCRKIRSAAIDWGNRNEETALRLYSTIMGETFSKCGVFIDKTRNFLAATPDGIDKSSYVLVEIKCPFSSRYEKPEEASFLKNGSLKKDHAYYVQVQLQMHVTGIRKADFVVWTTKGIFIQPIAYDQKSLDDYLSHIDFYYDHVFSSFYYKLIADKQ